MTRLLPSGEFALLAETDGTTQAQALYAMLADRRAAGEFGELLDLVPAARTVLVVAQPTEAGRADLALASAAVRGWSPANASTPAGPLVELGVHYDGPDLGNVAELLGVTADEITRWHAGVEYRVAFCGFAPGFAYLTGVPQRLRVARLDTPRTRVPAGAVGLADEFCGVYPRQSPGGWRLIGRTDEVLWDVDREPAALLAPGTRVRFRPV